MLVVGIRILLRWLPGLDGPQEDEIGRRLNEDDVSFVEQCLANQVDQLGRAGRDHGPVDDVREGPLRNSLLPFEQPDETTTEPRIADRGAVLQDGLCLVDVLQDLVNGLFGRLNREAFEVDESRGQRDELRISDARLIKLVIDGGDVRLAAPLSGIRRVIVEFLPFP